MDNSTALCTGWGRAVAGRYGKNHGFDVLPLRTSDAMGFADGVKVQKLSNEEIAAISARMGPMGMAAHSSPDFAGVAPYDQFEADTRRFKVVQTQEHHLMEGRPIAIDRTSTSTGRHRPSRSTARRIEDPPLWDRQKYSDYKWACRSTSTRALAAAHASWRAKQRTISPRSAGTWWLVAARCTGCASIATS